MTGHVSTIVEPRLLKMEKLEVRVLQVKSKCSECGEPLRIGLTCRGESLL